jgi:Condensation domain
MPEERTIVAVHSQLTRPLRGAGGCEWTRAHRLWQAPAMHEARPLGGNEKAFWKLDQASPLNFAVLAHLGARLDDAPLERALAGLQARHPLLRARIERRSGQPWFAWPPAPAPIPLAVHAVARDAWQPLVEDELRRRFHADDAPLARALRLDHEQGCTLVLLFHHAIADGMGGVAALRDVVWEAATGKPFSPVVHERSLAAESALPARARGVRGGLRRIATVAGLAAAGVRHKDPLKVPVEQAAAPHQRTFHVELRTLDAATSAALAARARAAGATVHAAIGAAMIFAIARAADLREERSVVFGSPINVRDQLAPPMGDQLGMYLAASHYRGTVAPGTQFWSLACAIRARIIDDLESGRAVDALPLITLFYDSLGGDRASAEDFGRKWAESNGTTGLTNLGRIVLEPPPGVPVERVHFLGFPSGLDVFNAMASSYAGELTISFNWPEPCFERSGALALVDDIEATLRAAIAGDAKLRR